LCGEGLGMELEHLGDGEMGDGSLR
jgi:hypothetical protein